MLKTSTVVQGLDQAPPRLRIKKMERLVIAGMNVNLASAAMVVVYLMATDRKAITVFKTSNAQGMPVSVHPEGNPMACA